MTGLLSNPVTKKFTNLSTPDSYLFAFHCDRCNAEARSEQYIFNTEGFGQLNEPIRTLLWNRQHDEAYERANSEAKFEFNICPVCGRRVCCQCFQDNPETGGLCLDCI